MDENNAKKVLDALARMCGYSRCVMPNYVFICFIDDDDSSTFTYIYYDKVKMKLLTSDSYTDALKLLYSMMQKGDCLLYVANKRRRAPLKPIRKEHLNMLKFELALEGIDLDKVVNI